MARRKERRAMLEDFKELLVLIFNTNERVRYYERQALMNAIAAKWRWVKHYESLHKRHEISAFEEIFDVRYKPSANSRLKDLLAQNRTTRARLQKAAGIVVRLFVKPTVDRIMGKRR
jgi:hypothetical protein